MLKKINSYLIFCLIFLAACSSSSVIRINSVPEDAQVSVININGTLTPIGKTPLISNEMELYREGRRYSQLKISKENFHPQNIALMKSVYGSETNINIQLKKEETNLNSSAQINDQEKVATTIARANGLIQAKQFSEAENLLLNFTEQYPGISVGYDYLGNLNYLQKKFPKALKYYSKALSLNPTNTERRVIVEKLQNAVKSTTGEVQ